MKIAVRKVRRDAFPLFLVLFVLAVLADSVLPGYPWEILPVYVGLFVAWSGVRCFSVHRSGNAAHRPAFPQALCAVAAF